MRKLASENASETGEATEPSTTEQDISITTVAEEGNDEKDAEKEGFFSYLKDKYNEGNVSSSENTTTKEASESSEKKEEENNENSDTDGGDAAKDDKEEKSSSEGKEEESATSVEKSESDNDKGGDQNAKLNTGEQELLTSNEIVDKNMNMTKQELLTLKGIVDEENKSKEDISSERNIKEIKDTIEKHFNSSKKFFKEDEEAESSTISKDGNPESSR